MKLYLFYGYDGDDSQIFKREYIDIRAFSLYSGGFEDKFLYEKNRYIIQNNFKFTLRIYLYNKGMYRK